MSEATRLRQENVRPGPRHGIHDVRQWPSKFDICAALKETESGRGEEAGGDEEAGPGPTGRQGPARTWRGHRRIFSWADSLKQAHTPGQVVLGFIFLPCPELPIPPPKRPTYQSRIQGPMPFAGYFFPVSSSPLDAESPEAGAVYTLCCSRNHAAPWRCHREVWE